MDISALDYALNLGKGILRLSPTWVPRSFCRPGKRIKLHPNDYYVFGLHRGGIDERWLSSTTPADNGPNTPFDEGLSYVIIDQKARTRILLRDAVNYLKGEIIGQELWDKYHKWPMFSKFFDNLGPLPHHIHHRDKHAALVGEEGKPEMYFFPSQLNNHQGEFGFTFFGLNPGTTREQLRNTLENFEKGDNGILYLSRCFKLKLDTGWDVPPGILHAPGSLCTYEPQFASDVYAMFQSVLYGEHCVPSELLWKNCPPEQLGNIDYLLDLLDWDLNVDPYFYEHRFMQPLPVTNTEDMINEGYIDEWICYRSSQASAKRLTIMPERTVTIHDSAAYGLIVIQGRGYINNLVIETPSLIRYGQITNDEYFVTEQAARNGVVIYNPSKSEPIVLLRHFSENPDLVDFIRR